jgi:hypothetical protein
MLMMEEKFVHRERLLAVRREGCSVEEGVVGNTGKKSLGSVMKVINNKETVLIMKILY